MINLFEEIEDILKQHKKTIKDIKYVSFGDYNVDVFTFLVESTKINYDNGYGIIEINQQLKIIGEDWWLERVEYDGAEGFVFKQYPEVNKEMKKFDKDELVHSEEPFLSDWEY